MPDLEHDQQLSTLLFERTPCLVATIDPHHRIVRANPAFTELFGSVAGKLCHRVYKQHDQPCNPCIATKVFESGVAQYSEEIGRSKTGNEVRFRVHCLPLPNKKYQIPQVLQIGVDTTEPTELKQQLQQAERLASVGLTTAGLAHTIKNILAGLEGATYLVSSALDKNDEQRLRGGWEMVHKYIEQVSVLVKNLLRYAKATEPQRQQVEPAELLQDVVQLFASKAEMIGISLDMELDAKAPSCWIDCNALHACLSNLITNALDACAWDPATGKKHRVVVRIEPLQNGGVAFEVSDNGMGISEENQHKILSTSFTTKGIRGTGLGLLLTKKAVREHGGHIEFSSTHGQGTTFRLCLPAGTAMDS